jgi:hypothetical protein
VWCGQINGKENNADYSSYGLPTIPVAMGKSDYAS